MIANQKEIDQFANIITDDIANNINSRTYLNIDKSVKDLIRSTIEVNLTLFSSLGEENREWMRSHGK